MGGREISGGILLFIMGFSDSAIIQTVFWAQKTKHTQLLCGKQKKLLKASEGMGDEAIIRAGVESGSWERLCLTPVPKPKDWFHGSDSGEWEWCGKGQQVPSSQRGIRFRGSLRRVCTFLNCLTSAVREQGDSSWHVFSHLPGSLFTLVTHRPAWAALSVNPTWLLISRSLAG